MNEAPILNFKRPMRISILALAVLLGGIFTWSYTSKIAGAVIASGSVVVKGKPKSIQHLDGGIISVINVADGDRVKVRQPLIELDDTTISANLTIYRGRLKDTLIRKSRLLAELESRSDFDVPLDLIEKLRLGEVKTTLAQQKALMSARRLTREGQLAQLDEKINQFKNQISGVNALIREKKLQIDAFAQEHEAMSKLVRQGLAKKSQYLSLVRSQADMRGQIAEHKAEIARILNSISETKISKLQIVREFREKVVTEIEQLDTKSDELRQQIQATEKQLARVVIKSPVTGIVHELSVFTISGVVRPGQVLMQIIPSGDELEIELRVDTRSIDQIHINQKAIVRFPAFHQRTTPELDGKIAAISPTSVVDEKLGISFYRVLVAISDIEMARLGKRKVIPGMPVEAFIPTTERTVLTYLLKPFTDQLYHAFREE